MSEKHESLLWPELGIWLALLALVAISFVSAFIPMGAFNSVVSYGVAIIKTTLVVWIFMHMKSSPPLIRIAGAASLFWFFVLFALTWADFLTRV